MRTKHARALLQALIFGVVGCAGQETSREAERAAAPTKEAQPPSSASTDKQATTSLLGPHETLAIDMATNEIQVEATTVGEERGMDPRVREFAETVRADHQRALARVQALGMELAIVLTMTPETRRMRELARVRLDEVVASPGESFDRAFMELMIETHAEALGIFDTRLIPAAEGKLREHLIAEREELVKHLNAARTVRDQLIEAPIARHGH